MQRTQRSIGFKCKRIGIMKAQTRTELKIANWLRQNHLTLESGNQQQKEIGEDLETYKSYVSVTSDV